MGLAVIILLEVSKQDSREAYEKLKRTLQRLGFVRPGSLVRRFMPCGKPSCRCMADPTQLHGPYYQWTMKLRGKTVTLRLGEGQARLCEEWVANHRSLKAIVRKMEALGLKETDRLLRKAM